MTDLQFALTIAVMGGVTALLRFLPFFLFGKGRKTPAFIGYLGRVLPYATMAMLVVFCLRDIEPLSFPFGLPELIASALVVGLHVWRRNTLISILGGTVAYMLLVQLVF